MHKCSKRLQLINNHKWVEDKGQFSYLIKSIVCMNVLHDNKPNQTMEECQVRTLCKLKLCIEKSISYLLLAQRFLHYLKQG